MIKRIFLSPFVFLSMRRHYILATFSIYQFKKFKYVPRWLVKFVMNRRLRLSAAFQAARATIAYILEGGV